MVTTGVAIVSSFPVIPRSAPETDLATSTGMVALPVGYRADSLTAAGYQAERMTTTMQNKAATKLLTVSERKANIVCRRGDFCPFRNLNHGSGFPEQR
jgi:hypothetical protein